MNRPDRVGKAFEGCGVTGLALPDGEDSPAGRLQRTAVAIIAGAVGGDFGDPVSGVGLDLSPAVDRVVPWEDAPSVWPTMTGKTVFTRA